MTVMLSSLRITADMDASGYARGAAQIKAGSDQAGQAAKSLGQALAQQDAALANGVPGMARLSRELITGYGEGARFQAQLQRIEGALNRGMGADRAALMIENLYERTGMAASATDLWNQKLQMTAQVVDQVNRKIAARPPTPPTQDQTNQRIGIRPEYRGEDSAALATSLDQLRAKYDPLYAAENRHRLELEEINKAYRIGAFGAVGTAGAQGVLNKATQDSNQRLEMNKLALGATNQAARLTAGAYNNLAFQMNDVLTGLALGQPMWQVAAQQGGQIYQVFSMAGEGMGGFGNAVRAGVGGLKDTVVWLARAFGGYIAMGAGALSALAAINSFSEGQREVVRRMTGAGLASGLSLSGINQIANNSSVSGLSISEAREFATTLAETGRIGREEIGPLVEIGKDIARVYGVDATEAAQMLAKAYQDPVRGAEQLNQRLGAFDAATLRNIANLVRQNDVMGAQRLITEGIRNGISGISGGISTTTQLWTTLGNVASNVWGKFGAAASRVTGIGFVEGLDDQIKRTEVNIERLKQRLSGMSSNARSGSDGQRLANMLDAEAASLAKLKKSWDGYTASVGAAQQRRNSVADADAVRRQLPELAQRETLQNELLHLNLIKKAAELGGGANLNSMGTSWDEVTLAIARANGELNLLNNTAKQTLTGLEIALQAVNARSPQQKGEVAYEQSLHNQRTNSPEAIQIAEKERSLAIAQATRQIVDAERDRLESARQRADLAGVEIGLLGRTSVEQERIRAITQARHTLEQDAVRTYDDRAAYDRNHLAALTEEINKEAQKKNIIANNEAVRLLVPEKGDGEALKNTLARLYDIRDELASRGDDVKGLTFIWNELTQAIIRAAGKMEDFKIAGSDFARAKRDLEIQRDAIYATSPKARGEITYRQSMSGARSQDDDAKDLARIASANTILGIEKQIADAKRDQLLVGNQRLESAGLELRILGLAAAQQDAERSKLQAKHQLEQEALRIYGDREAYDRRHLAALEDQISREAAIKQTLAEQQAVRDLRFERDQIGRGPIESGVATKLRSIYGDGYESQMNGAIAAQIRFNAQLKIGHDLAADFATGFARDIRSGIEPLQALNNALGRVMDRLSDMIMEQLARQAIAGLVGLMVPGGGGLMGSLMGGMGLGTGTQTGGLYASGGYTGSMPADRVAGLVHGQEFVINARATAKHFSLLQAINNDNRAPDSVEYIGRSGILAPQPAAVTPGSGPAIVNGNSAPFDRFHNRDTFGNSIVPPRLQESVPAAFSSTQADAPQQDRAQRTAEQSQTKTITEMRLVVPPRLQESVPAAFSSTQADAPQQDRAQRTAEQSSGTRGGFKHFPLLKAINENRLPGYGGYAGRGESAASGSVVEFHLHPPSGVESREEKSRRADGGERIDIYQKMKDVAISAIRSGDADRALTGRYPMKRTVPRR